MSVFTPLERHELEVFLAPYGLGRLKDFQGIAAGTENSNFFVSLDGGEFVLTLVERGPRADMPFFVALLERLHRAGLPVPYAVPTQSGEALRELAEKPAILQPRLAGKHIGQPNAHHCAEVGSWLARLHLATRDDILERRSDRGLDWMLEEGPMLALELHDEQLPLLRDSLHEVAELKDVLARGHREGYRQAYQGRRPGGQESLSAAAAQATQAAQTTEAPKNQRGPC